MLQVGGSLAKPSGWPKIRNHAILLRFKCIFKHQMFNPIMFRSAEWLLLFREMKTIAPKFMHYVMTNTKQFLKIGYIATDKLPEKPHLS